MNPLANVLLVLAGYVGLMAWIVVLMAAGLSALTMVQPPAYLGGVLILLVAFSAVGFGIWSFGKVLRL